MLGSKCRHVLLRRTVGAVKSSLTTRPSPIGTSASLHLRVGAPSVRFLAPPSRFLSTSEERRRELSIEEEYSRKTPLEHVLLRPGMYVGPNERLSNQEQWTLEEPVPSPTEAMRKGSLVDLKTYKKEWQGKIVKRSCEAAPALLKVFDEILVNASDNRLRHPKSSTRIDVVIDPGKKGIRPPLIRVFNDGKGIPVQMHRKEKVYVPELLFGHLLTGSNFDDSIKKLTGGRHGYGAKLTNIFSKSFTVEVADSFTKKRYQQTWSDNMTIMGPPDIVPDDTGKDYTCISFVPDLERLTGMKGAWEIGEDEYVLMCRRVMDVAGCAAGKILTTLNGRVIPVATFDSYISLYRPPEQPTVFHAQRRWAIGIGLSKQDFEFVSFVNGMATSRGGTHVDAVADQVVSEIKERIGRMDKSLLKYVSRALVKRHLFVAIDALVENPAFDSQMKERLTTMPENFGSSCVLPQKFLKSLMLAKESGGPGIVEEIVQAAQTKQQHTLVQEVGKKKSKHQLLEIPKLEDAHRAGTEDGHQCTLILTEGDSAKALAVAGLEVVGRDQFGVFPLRGKFLNVRQASVHQLKKNEEVKALCSVLRLDFGTSYKTVAERSKLRYGKVMLMTDMDKDGSHIKGLVINFFRHFWPHLLRPADDEDPDNSTPFLSTFITPLLKARKGKEVLSFYSDADFNEWSSSVGADASSWAIKYYKGLGTSTSEEAKEYFTAFDKHVRTFQWRSDADGDSLDMAFDRERADDRRVWIDESFDQSSSIYSRQVSEDASVSYEEFVNKELVQFSHGDNIRSIPSVIDGLKPSQRKVLFACFKRKLKSEIKVAQLSGYCAEHTAYHHGEASLHSTIIKMAQDYVGSNNINLLVPSGQFGTRLVGGEDAASPRYIFTHLSPVTRVLFPELDDALVPQLEDDGQLIEPQYYCPIIPLLLVNGAKGIGTGWSTHVPPHSPTDIVDYLRAKLDGQLSLPEIKPYVKGFTGTVAKHESGGYVSTGRASKQSSTSILVDELPLMCWTNKYKEYLLKLREEGEITSFLENHTTTKVSFELKVPRKEMHRMMRAGLQKSLKLTSMHSTSNMHAFDADGNVMKFESPEEIAEAFFPVRLGLYQDRRSLLLSSSEYQALMLRNKARFIQLVASGGIDLVNGKVPKAVALARLDELGFDSVHKLDAVRENNSIGKTKHVPKQDMTPDNRFDYLLTMPLSSLTLERIEDLEKEAKQRDQQLEEIRTTTPEELWHRDLNKLLPFLDMGP